jgi:hypothetical protein
MARKLAFITALVLVAALAACGPRGGGREIKSGTVGGLSVTLANGEGLLRQGQQEFIVTFRDPSGKTVDVGAASLNFYMPAMGTMPPMNTAATLKTTSTPGVYQGHADIEMAGEWQAQIAYEGPAGSGKGTLAVTAQ